MWKKERKGRKEKHHRFLHLLCTAPADEVAEKRDKKGTEKRKGKKTSLAPCASNYDGGRGRKGGKKSPLLTQADSLERKEKKGKKGEEGEHELDRGQRRKKGCWEKKRKGQSNQFFAQPLTGGKGGPEKKGREQKKAYDQAIVELRRARRKRKKKEKKKLWKDAVPSRSPHQLVQKKKTTVQEKEREGLERPIPTIRIPEKKRRKEKRKMSRTPAQSPFSREHPPEGKKGGNPGKKKGGGSRSQFFMVSSNEPSSCCERREGEKKKTGEKKRGRRAQLGRDGCIQPKLFREHFKIRGGGKREELGGGRSATATPSYHSPKISPWGGRKEHREDKGREGGEEGERTPTSLLRSANGGKTGGEEGDPPPFLDNCFFSPK